MSTIIFPIKCFGAFRKFGENLNVEVPAGSSADQIKQALIRILGEQHKGLVEDSVLASDTAVLPGAYILKEPVDLCILPPVCGG
ncbi:MAG: hypothetical protein H6858_03260 [Rhodospirillales bacterium]|nr:hypothetical protein [Rhodospirillales bacterium]